MPYIPALNGIRAFAVLLVFAFHAKIPALNTGGYVGVDIFFVLSGFLITSLLLKEYDGTGTLRIGRFYLRRFARLMPPLAVLIALYLGIAPLAWPESDYYRDAFISVTYLGDLIPSFWVAENPIAHTWSLAVEEHYYLLWPALVLLAVRAWPSRLPHILLVAYLAATLWRGYFVMTGQDWDTMYHRFDLRTSGLILGSWLASVVHRRPDLAAPSLNRMALPILLGVILIFGTGWKDPLSLILAIPSAEMLTVVMILVVRTAGDSTLHRALNAPGMVYLGKISYGFYLYHYPVMHGLRLLGFEWLAVSAISLPVSIALASLSYYTVEKVARDMRIRTASATPA